MIHARPDYNRIQDPENKIPVDEPVFIIRGQDKVGAAAVRMWAILNDAAGGDPHLSEMAREHAELMDMWPKKKRADFVKPKPIDNINECLHAENLDYCRGLTTMDIGLPLTEQDMKQLEEEQKEPKEDD